MSKCGEKTEVYSRVCGYFRPVSNWNKGKREEFKDRKNFEIKSETIIALCFLVLCMVLSGCATTETIARGITTKNISGNGTVVNTHIGIDAETRIPELQTTFVSGDFSTVKAGTNAVTYREESSASAFNAESITTKRFLSITLTDCGDVPAVISAVAKVLRESNKSTTKK